MLLREFEIERYAIAVYLVIARMEVQCVCSCLPIFLSICVSVCVPVCLHVQCMLQWWGSMKGSLAALLLLTWTSTSWMSF